MANITLQEMYDEWKKAANGIGTPSDSAQPDPTQAATIIAALKGQLERLGDLLEQMQGNGTGAMPVQLTGSIVPLATQTSNITVTAGSTITLLDNTNVKDFISLRAGSYWGTTPSSWKMTFYFMVRDEGSIFSIAMKNRVSTALKDAVEEMVVGAFGKVTLTNDDTVNRVLVRSQVLGVR